MSGAFAFLFGFARLVVGVEPDRGGWVRVYLDARYRNRYILLQPGPEADGALAQWRGWHRHLVAEVPGDAVVFEGEPVLGLA